MGEIRAMLRQVIDTQSKTIYALIAVIGATIGLKFTNSPPILIVFVWVNLFVFLFAAIVATARRKELQHWYWIAIFGIGGVAANVIRLATCEGGINEYSQILYIVSNTAMVLYLWNGRAIWKPQEERF